jgi:hypothetical protein
LTQDHNGNLILFYPVLLFLHIPTVYAGSMMVQSKKSKPVESEGEEFSTVNDFDSSGGEVEIGVLVKEKMHLCQCAPS